MTRYYAAQAHVLGGPGVGHHRQGRGARQPLLRARRAAAGGRRCRLHRSPPTRRPSNRRSPQRATSATGSRCGSASCRSPSPRLGLVALVGGALLGSFSLRAESALIDPGLDTCRSAGSSAGANPTPGRCRPPRPRPRSCRRSGRRTCRRIHSTVSDRAGSWRAGLRAGAGVGGDGAAAGAGLSAAARRGVDPAVVSVRRRAGPVGGRAAGAAAGFRGGAGLACARRRCGGQGAAGGRVVAGRLGRGPAGGRGAARGGCAGPVRRGHAGGLESLCGRTAFAGPLESAGRLRLPAVGGDGDAAAAHVVRRLGGLRAGVLDRAGRADADRADAGRGGRAGVCRSRRVAGGRGGCARAWAWAPRCWRRCPGWWPRRCPARCRPSQARRVSRRSRPAPSRGSARWAAWPASAGSGTPRPYPPLGQRFSRWSSAVVLLGVVAAGLAGGAAPTRRGAAVDRWRRSRWWCRPRWPPDPGWRSCEATVRTLPGLGVVRDGQKWVALAVPGYAVARRGGRRHAAALACPARQRRWCAVPRSWRRCPTWPGGCGGKVTVGALPAGLGGGRGGDQRRPATGRGAARRQHAAVLLGRSRAGARSAAPLGARRRADDG